MYKVSCIKNTGYNIKTNMNFFPIYHILNTKYHSTIVKPKRSFGFTIVELLIYLAIFTAFSILAINMLLTMTRAFAEARVVRDVNHAGLVSMERLSREIRGAESIDTGMSSFGANPGVLKLDGTDGLGAARSVRFYVLSGVLKIDENGVYLGDLTDPSVAVTNLIFRTFNTAQGSFVKVEMTLRATRGLIVRTENFYNGAILRGDY